MNTKNQKTGTINRRKFLKGVAAGVTAACAPKIGTDNALLKGEVGRFEGFSFRTIPPRDIPGSSVLYGGVRGGGKSTLLSAEL